MGGGLGLGIVWAWALWAGHKGDRVESTGPGGVGPGGFGRFVGVGGARLGGYCSMLAGHKVQVVKRNMDERIFKTGGLMS